jgi:phosphate transport system substrate-binding protein
MTEKRSFLMNVKKVISINILSIVVIWGFAFFLYAQESFDDEPVKVPHDINLSRYAPFLENSKLVILNEKASFTLFDDLPQLDGATALYPVYASFVQAVYPSAGYGNRYVGTVQCTQTASAYTGLINGTRDIIFCAEPSTEQLEQAAQNNIEFNMTPIGKDAFVFFVNKDNPIDNITSEQLQKIYSGEITNWAELGGEDRAIIPYQRPKNSGSQTVFENLVMKDSQIIEPEIEEIVYAMGGMIEQVAEYTNYPAAIGYSFLFFSQEMVRNDEIKLLAVNSVIPSKETIQSGEYLFSGNFYAITTGNESENTKNFIDWILSEEGQYLIEKTGYVPLGSAF